MILLRPEWSCSKKQLLIIYMVYLTIKIITINISIE